MNLFNRLNNLLPALNSEDIVLQDNSDGNGAFIAEWNSELSQPTEAEIAGASDTWIVGDLILIRAKRDAALAATDWAALPDSPVMSSAMTTYRTALRDYPATYASDNSAAFPELGAE